MVKLRVPELRERADDVLVLAEHFRQARGRTSDTPTPRGFSPDAREALLEHEWPGNVRELDNRVQRALLVARGAEITAEDLGLPERDDPAAPADPERAEIEEALKDADGVVARAAATLGLTRQAMYRRMGRTGVRLERRVKGAEKR